MNIGIDFDGPGHIFWHGLKKYLDAKKIPYDDSAFQNGLPCCWDFYKHFNWGQKTFKKHVDAGVDANYVFRGPLLPGFRESLEEIKSMGHQIHIITDRFFGADPSNSHKATYMSLAENMILWDSVTFSADKTIVPCDMFVEDKIENYDALEAAGTEVYLINYPWNQRNDDRRRIANIVEFVDKVRERSQVSV